MIATSYPCPLPDGTSVDEYTLAFDRGLEQRVLIIPALFDEGHRMRRLCVDVMRRLDGSGIDSCLPDLPGTNESRARLGDINLLDWAVAISAAAKQFRATHILAVRGGGLVTPPGLRGWHYGAVNGASLLRTLIRAQVLSSRENDREVNGDDLLRDAQERGTELAGYHLGAAMVQQLQAAKSPQWLVELDQELIGGNPLWLRTEPDADGMQADALAAYLTMAIRG